MAIDQSLFSDLVGVLSLANDQYHQLVIHTLKASDASDWKEVAKTLDGRYINLNLELSRALLELPKRQWPHKAMELMDKAASFSDAPITLLDRIEILFDRTLCLDPLKSLQQVARRQCLLVVWPGERDTRYLTYAEPGHPEYCRYSHKDLLMFPSMP